MSVLFQHIFSDRRRAWKCFRSCHTALVISFLWTMNLPQGFCHGATSQYRSTASSTLVASARATAAGRAATESCKTYSSDVTLREDIPGRMHSRWPETEKTSTRRETETDCGRLNLPSVETHFLWTRICEEHCQTPAQKSERVSRQLICGLPSVWCCMKERARSEGEASRTRRTVVCL